MRVRNIDAVVIEGGKGADDTANNGHGMSIPAEATIKVVDLFVQHRMVSNVMHKLRFF